MDIALAIFLLLSPIILLPSISNITALQFYQFGVIDSSNSYLQLQFFQFGIIVLYLISLLKEKVRKLNDKWLFLFLGCCLISVFLHPKSVQVFSNVFLGFLLYKLVFEYAKRIRLLLFTIVIVSVLNFIFEVFQLFGFNLIYHDTGTIVGLMKSPSHLGTYQALAIPIYYYFNPFLAIIPIVGLLLTKTWTAIFAVILVICLKFRKKIIGLGTMWIMFGASLTALLILLFYKKILAEFLTRFWVWGETIKSLTFTGYGLGKFKITYTNVDKFFDSVYKNETFDNPYNVYLGIIYALGIFSIPIFIWLYKTLKIRNKLFPSCLILVIIALGQSFMDFPRLAGIVIILFALLNLKEVI